MLKSKSKPRRRIPQNTLAPVHPNFAVELQFRRQLLALIREMQASIVADITAQYPGSDLGIAQDAWYDVHRLRAEFERLGRRWLDRFNVAAREMAAYFATAAKDRVDGALAASLRKAGFSVRFQVTPKVAEAIEASVAESVSLIKSIPQQHLAQVEQMVMRSVTAGRDTHGLKRDLQKRLGVTERRAAFIAHNQNNMATSAITKARQQELGITKAIWVHSSAGRKPRAEHVAFNNHEYDVAKGAYLEGVWTWPGRQPNCRCISRSILPGLSRPTVP